MTETPSPVPTLVPIAAADYQRLTEAIDLERRIAIENQARADLVRQATARVFAVLTERYALSPTTTYELAPGQQALRIKE